MPQETAFHVLNETHILLFLIQFLLLLACAKLLGLLFERFKQPTVTAEQEPETQLRIYSQLLRVAEREEAKQSLIKAPDPLDAVGMLNKYLRASSLNA